MWMILMLTMMAAASAAECPRLCDCKWRSGKKAVMCAHAELTEIPSHLDSATQLLNLTDNQLLTLQDKAFSSTGLVNLQRLYLSYCSIDTIANDAFQILENLVELDLSYNLLAKIPSHAFIPIKELRNLLLSGNRIQKVHNEAFRALPHLVRLILSYCKISEIEPRAFVGLESSLQYVDLRNNNLQVIYVASIAPLRILDGIELAFNPWDCSCILRSLREWMTRNNMPMTTVPDCALPPRLTSKSWDRLDLDDFACKPEVTTKRKKLKGVEGDEVTIVCRVLGVPAPRVRWVRAGRILANISTNVNSNRAYMLRSEGQTSNLTIKSAEMQDTGSYTCSAENRAGKAEVVINLTIEKKPPINFFGGRALIAGVAVFAVILLSSCIIGLCIYETRKKRQLARWNEQVVTRNQREDSYEKMDSSLKNNIEVPILPTDGGRTRGNYRNVPSHDPEDHYEGYVRGSARFEAESSLTPPIVPSWRHAEYESRNVMPERDLHIPRLSDYHIRPDDTSASVQSSISMGAMNRRQPTQARPRTRDRFENDTSGSDSDKNYPDLIEMSALGPSYLRGGFKHDPYNFYTMPRKKGDSRSPLLSSRRNSSGGDSVSFFDRNYEANRYRAPRRRSNSFLDLSLDNHQIYRNPSLPASPSRTAPVPSATPLLNLAELRDIPRTQQFVEDTDFRASELEKFLEEYRCLAEQFSRLKETRENLQRSRIIDNKELRSISTGKPNIAVTETSSSVALADAASPLVLGTPEYRPQQPKSEWLDSHLYRN